MNERIPNCQAHMPITTLSAWYDHHLDQAEDARVQAHVDTCAACQSYMRMFQSTAQFIQADNPPDIHASIWRGVQQGKQSQAAHKRSFVPIAALSAVTVVALIFVAVFVFLAREQGKQPPITVATGIINPIMTSTTQPTVNALHPDPSQGWVKVPVLSFSKDIVFSQSDPYTGYACGNSTTKIASTTTSVTPLLVTATHDGGRTWSTPIATPSHNHDCAIFNNPSNPQDIFLEGNDFTSLTTLGYYRSLDGGLSWTKINVPPGNQGDQSNWLSIPTWVGATMFVGASGTPHILAVSINDGPLEWADNSAPFARLGYYSFGGFYAINKTLYVIYSPSQNSLKFAKTSDDGTSWSTFIPQGISGGANYPSVAIDGHTLLVATDQTDRLATSSDDGQSWTLLPAFPPNYNLNAGYQNFGVTTPPDKIIYASLHNFVSPGSDSLYLLAPGGTSWSLPSGSDWGGAIAVSWNTEGHAVAAWRTLPSNYIDESPGIEYRGL